MPDSDTPLAITYHRNTMLSPLQPPQPPREAPAEPFKEYPNAPLVRLPQPRKLRRSLGATIAARLSCRQFSARAPALPALATLLHAVYGVLGSVQLEDYELLTRPVPSGGALYPLEFYLLVRRVRGLAPAVYHYAPLLHALEWLAEAPPAARLSELFVGQAYAASAAFVAVQTAVLQRSVVKYGERSYRLIMLEAGHAAQNLNLASSALGLGSVNMAGFYDAQLAATLGLTDEQELPIYTTAVGVPRRLSEAELRQPQRSY